MAQNWSELKPCWRGGPVDIFEAFAISCHALQLRHICHNNGKEATAFCTDHIFFVSVCLFTLF